MHGRYGGQPSRDVEGRLVPEEGVEPTHSCLYGILSPARLPVPPFRHELLIIAESCYWWEPFHVPEGRTTGADVRQLAPRKVPLKDRRSDAMVPVKT